MNQKIIDGKKIAQIINEESKNEYNKIKNKYNIELKLAIILIGNNKSSIKYIQNKILKSSEIGIITEVIELNDNINQEKLNSILKTLGEDKNIHGIIIQMPIPKHLSFLDAIQNIPPIKDVDGLHPYNIGMLHIGELNNSIQPCTPLGCIQLIKSCFENTIEELKSKEILIIGRSSIVGWPLLKLLNLENTTITSANSFSKDLKKLCLQNEIIISAAGIPNLIKEDMVKENHIIIDVGITNLEENNSFKFVGDVDFQNIFDKVRKITPVPGGVGPMTIANLIKNLFKAFYLQKKL